MLVGELHGDTATEGMPDQRDAGDAELVEKVAQPYREGSQRVIRAWLIGLPVAEQIGCDHPVPGREMRHHLTPGLRTAAHPVDEQHR